MNKQAEQSGRSTVVECEWLQHRFCVRVLAVEARCRLVTMFSLSVSNVALTTVQWSLTPPAGLMGAGCIALTSRVGGRLLLGRNTRKSVGRSVDSVVQHSQNTLSDGRVSSADGASLYIVPAGCKPRHCMCMQTIAVKLRGLHRPTVTSWEKEGRMVASVLSKVNCKRFKLIGCQSAESRAALNNH